ncbi:MAG: M23 family metallopeptidase [Chlorobi bacterium]|nr:M23 family metallopeptidase [Chlorobiota bacterium]
MNYRKIILPLFVFLSLLLPGKGEGQSVSPSKAGFSPPVDFPLYLSGTFGELRSNHFHAGIDIKTKGREGEAIRTIGDGYVSRIKVSTGGYGNVLYVTHPNGYVSVYGHLQKFNDPIREFVKEFQYKRESFTVEIFPEKGKFPVKKGEIIGWSGNSGSSSAPHLHFEIRKAASQHPVNPLLFDKIRIEDSYSPRIQELVIYPVDRHSQINGKNDTVFYPVTGKGDQHTIQGNPRISVSGSISLGVRVYDPMDGISNRNGIYKLDILMDTLHLFGLELDELSFATSRYINSLIDYNYFQKDKRKVIRTQIDTNNLLFIYRDVCHNGILTFNDSSVHKVVLKVSDVYGNKASLRFDLHSIPPDSSLLTKKTDPPKGIYFDFSKKHHIDAGSLILDFPANAFYRSFYFHLDSLPGDSTMLSPVYEVHNRFTPVQKSFSISIQPAVKTVSFADRFYIAYLDKDGQSWFTGNDKEGVRLSAKTNLLGNYVVLADTVAPEIIPVNIAGGKNMAGERSIKIKISDKETGIKKYRATLNGRWILMEYEPKKNLLFYEIDDHLKKGINQFRLEVTDMVGNESVYEAELLR